MHSMEARARADRQLACGPQQHRQVCDFVSSSFEEEGKEEEEEEILDPPRALEDERGDGFSIRV